MQSYHPQSCTRKMDSISSCFPQKKPIVEALPKNCLGKNWAAFPPLLSQERFFHLYHPNLLPENGQHFLFNSTKKSKSRGPPPKKSSWKKLASISPKHFLQKNGQHFLLYPEKKKKHNSRRPPNPLGKKMGSISPC